MRGRPHHGAFRGSLSAVTTKQHQEQGQLVGAVDLGSNSFHLLIARWDGRRIQTVDKRKEMVRIAAGLDDRRLLSTDAEKRALGALKRFGEALDGISEDRVRAVGTNAFRAMRDPSAFIDRAERALGVRIEVLSGIEEARLIYVGVAHAEQPIDGHQLVIDIGGGSTELVLGRGFDALAAHSLRMGCVSYSKGFFPDGEINDDRFRGAIFSASNEAQGIVAGLEELGWDRVIGTSGTIRAVQAVITEAGWSDDDAVTSEHVERLRQAMIDAGKVKAIELAGLSERRRPVFAGGVAILEGLLTTLGIERMVTSDAALREGLVRDIVGRFEGKDLREHTVKRLQERYRVSLSQAERVADRLQSLWAAARDEWDLAPRWQRLTRWAALLHEVGLSVAYSGYHKHGAYLLEHIDMPGFSRSEQAILAALVLCHRRKFRHEALRAAAAASESETAVRAAALLRIAVRLERRRGGTEPHDVDLEVEGAALKLTLRGDRFDNHPLMLADLQAERDRLEQAGLELIVAD